jgi:integrase
MDQKREIVARLQAMEAHKLQQATNLAARHSLLTLIGIAASALFSILLAAYVIFDALTQYQALVDANKQLGKAHNQVVEEARRREIAEERLRHSQKMDILGAVDQGKAAKPMRKSNLKLVTPGTVFGAVPEAGPPRKRPNAEVRSREYLTEGEVERLIKAAGDNRHAHRDAAMMLVTFRHGLRTAEAIRLKWDAVDFDRGETPCRPRQERQARNASSLRT